MVWPLLHTILYGTVQLALSGMLDASNGLVLVTNRLVCVV